MRTLSRLLLALVLSFTACNPRGGIDPTPSPGSKSAGAESPKPPDLYGPLGSEAKRFLKPDGFERIIVEFHAVEGKSPNPEASRHLLEVLGQVTHKKTQSLSGGLEDGDGSYSAEELVAISKRNRSQNSTIHVLYLNGVFAENNRALGLAVSATLVVIFPDQINKAVSATIQPGSIEKAVLVHEIGHVLSLINIGHLSKVDHEDPDHPHHSKNERSVMFWAVEDLSVSNLLQGGPPAEFDEQDLEELQEIAES